MQSVPSMTFPFDCADSTTLPRSGSAWYQRWHLSQHHKEKWKDVCHARNTFCVAFGTRSKSKAYQLQGDCVLRHVSSLLWSSLLQSPVFIHIWVRCVASVHHFPSLRLLEGSEFGPSQGRWKQTLSEHKNDAQKDFEVLCLCHFEGCALLGFSGQVLPVNSWKQKLVVERLGEHELILNKFWGELCNARNRSVQPYLV